MSPVRTTVTAPTFEIDGIEHRVGDDTCCPGEDVHENCGGLWHFQGVYGGYVFECDRCHEKRP